MQNLHDLKPRNLEKPSQKILKKVIPFLKLHKNLTQDDIRHETSPGNRAPPGPGFRLGRWGPIRLFWSLLGCVGGLWNRKDSATNRLAVATWVVGWWVVRGGVVLEDFFILKSDCHSWGWWWCSVFFPFLSGVYRSQCNWCAIGLKEAGARWPSGLFSMLRKVTWWRGCLFRTKNISWLNAKQERNEPCPNIGWKNLCKRLWHN